MDVERLLAAALLVTELLSLVEPVRRRRNAARNEGFSATDSPRALINLVAIVSSFAHDGTRPQRRRWITRSPFDRCRTTGSHCIGAAFQRGSNSKPSDCASKASRRRETGP